MLHLSASKSAVKQPANLRCVSLAYSNGFNKISKQACTRPVGLNRGALQHGHNAVVGMGRLLHRQGSEAGRNGCHSRRIHLPRNTQKTFASKLSKPVAYTKALQ